MKVLVTGITGYMGSRLVPRLRRDGHEIRGFARNPIDDPELTVVQGDAISGVGLDQALDGIDVAYFLIHSMEASANGAFNVRELTAAENFARVAGECGVTRIIYLGGPMPTDGSVSPHLASRLAVEQILLAATSCSVAFRASIVIGAGSRSFRFLVRLVERMPVLAVPAWRTHRSAPIDERDMIELLARAATNDDVCGRSLDAGGRDIVSYGELIDRIRDLMLLDRPTIRLNRLTLTPVASRIAAAVAGEDPALIEPLMESLQHDLLPRDNRAAELLGVKLHSLDAAIERALRDWESTEPLAAR